jgi:hypothetical protein
MKRASALEPEYLILGLLNQQPDHGYELHRRVITEQAGLWHLPQNQVYNLLKRLEARGDISSAARSAASIDSPDGVGIVSVVGRCVPRRSAPAPYAWPS